MKTNLYDSIILSISEAVKDSLDETMSTYPYSKIKNYLAKKLKELDITIYEVNDKHIITNKKLNDWIKNKSIENDKRRINQFDDKQFYVSSLISNTITVNSQLYKDIIDVMLLVGYKKLSIIKGDGIDKDRILFTPNKQNYLDLSSMNLLYLYHICPHYVTNKIKKIGFVPKSKNSIFSYDPRIHFCFETDLWEYEYLRTLLDCLNKSKGNDHNYDLIKIMVPENINFQKDLDFEYGLYTTENIKPEYIVDIKPLGTIDIFTYISKKVNKK